MSIHHVLGASRDATRGPRWSGAASRPAVLLPFVLVSFAANSLATRYAVGTRLIDPGLLGAMRFIAGAITLVAVALVRREKVFVGRTNLRPALWLGTYALCISYGYRYIGAAAGTFVFYAMVLLTLVAHDLATGSTVPARRACGAAVSLGGIAILTFGSVGEVTLVGVVLLAVTGVAWGLYTAAGHTGAVDARPATTGHFLVVAAVGAPAATAGAVAGLRITAEGVAWAAAMGAGTTALAYVAWYVCQRSMSGTSAASAQLIVPLITTAGAVAFLGEQPSTTLLIAASFVGAGTWLARPAATLSGVATFSVRQARPADLERLRAIYRQSSLSNSGDREILLDHPGALVWSEDGIKAGRTRVATNADSVIVGFATTRPLETGVELDDLFVDPDWMRRGVATVLLADVIESAVRADARWIEVTANPHAAQFYASVGFRRYGQTQTRFGPADRLRRAVRVRHDTAAH